MRKYSKEYLEILKNNISIIENNGVDVILKPSPGEEREGYLDTCEKAILDGFWTTKLDDNNSKSIQIIEDELSEFDKCVKDLRDSMGFANYNLNTVEIYTKFITVKDSGNDVGVWCYYPRHLDRTKNNPALVFFHGGGWVGGTTYVVENFCKLIAERANCVVFNVDYSLAPEKPFPNGFNDNYAIVKHIYENADKYKVNKEKISVAGDSAGGNYAAAVSLRARDENIAMIAMQVLIYPAVIIGESTVDGYEWDEDAFNIANEQEELIRPMISLGRPEDISKSMFRSCYLPDPKEVYNPYVSPILAESHVGLPKAILVGAEFDGIRLQTEFYAKQLKEAGVDVKCYRYKGMTHAFIDKLGFVPQAEDLVDIISEEILKL